MKLPAFLTGLLKGFHTGSRSKRLNPARDWFALLTILLAFLAASLAWNVWFFLAVVAEEPTAPAAPVVQTSNTRTLDQARAAYEARALEEGRYRTEYRFIDPSK